MNFARFEDGENVLISEIQKIPDEKIVLNIDEAAKMEIDYFKISII